MSVQFITVAQACPTFATHGLQHARLPCLSPTPEACSNSCPLSWWCHPTISSSVVPFSSNFNLAWHQSLFQWVSSSNQMIRVLELELEHQSFQRIFRTDFLRIDWCDLLALYGTIKCLFQHHSSKASIFQCSAFFMVQLWHHTWLLEKP